MVERPELLESLRYLYDSLLGIEKISAQKQQLFNKIDSYKQEIQNEHNRRRSAGNRETFEKAGATATNVIGIAVTVIVLLVIYGIIALILMAMGVSGKVIGVLFYVFMVAGAGIVYLILKGTASMSKDSEIRRMRTAESAVNNIANIEAKIREIQEKQIPETEARLIIAYQDSQEIIEAFPPDYRYTYAVGRVISFIENLRADSIKEALNLYEKELYQDRMLSEQKHQTQAAEASAQANMASAAANIVTAFNTGQIASNTKQMVGTLRNIEGYSAQTAANTASIANSAAAAAANSARAAASAESMANSAARTEGYARQIRNSL